MIARDTGFVRQVHSMQLVGRRVFDEQRAFRRANPGFVNPNRPMRQPGQQPGQFRRNGLPGQQQPRTEPAGTTQQPGLRPGQQQPGRAGPAGLAQRPGSPQQGGQLQRPGQPSQTGPRPLPGQPGQPPLPALQDRRGQQQPGLPPRPGQPQQTGVPASPDNRACRHARPARGAAAASGRRACQVGRQAMPAQPPGQRPAPPTAARSATRATATAAARRRTIPPRRRSRCTRALSPGLQRPGLSGRPALQLPRRQAPAVPPAKGKEAKGRAVAH